MILLNYLLNFSLELGLLFLHFTHLIAILKYFCYLPYLVETIHKLEYPIFYLSVIYYEDEFGGLKLPFPNLNGEFQLSNVATAIATIRNLKNLNVSDENIKKGITSIQSIARLQEIKNGRLKKLCLNNKLFIDGSHNPLGAIVLNNFINKIHGNVHIILGMMNNKNHKEYVSYFDGKINSLTTIDIPNQKNSIRITCSWLIV